MGHESAAIPSQCLYHPSLDRAGSPSVTAAFSFKPLAVFRAPDIFALKSYQVLLGEFKPLRTQLTHPSCLHIGNEDVDEKENAEHRPEHCFADVQRTNDAPLMRRNGFVHRKVVIELR
ncbi:unnamed protein product [Nippostrongylus brasiliensis]|uniref:Uncharacterized protein n=1 Tax=Nippostrongylus brasiliensis TaxID=27835 RepID=A0A0N4XWP7_NIPBR|nr:unnamed protein product [Nippostrongylus brasiliensis]